MGSTRIMIVEDNSTVAKDLYECLEGLGYGVMPSLASGEESIERAEAERPDAVIMDIHLRTEMDGIEAAEQIYSRYQIPVIFLTAYSDPELLERAKQVGSFGYLVKPFDERELYANIEMTLHKARSERETQRLNEEIRRHKKKLQALAVELSSVAEQERKDVANELHENIVQIIMMALNHVKAVRKSENSPDQVSTLAQAVDLLNLSIKYARTLTYQLYPPNLRELGLDAALEWHLEQYQKDHPIVCYFTGDLNPKAVSDDIKGFLFRAVQELLVNTAKHAQADNVELSTWKTDDAICISIEDDGIGFDADKILSTVSMSSGFGLFSMRERLHDLGGKLSVDSEIGRGTKIMITAPNGNTTSAHAREGAVLET